MAEGATRAEERALPGNPNAVVFAADALEVFDRRSWRRVLELALGPLMALHKSSKLPVAAGYGWRVALDRRNRRKLQLTLYFVVDGPMTAEQLDGLERAMEHNPVRWSIGQMERVPGNGVLAWVAADSEASILLTSVEGRAVLSTLQLSGDPGRETVGVRVVDLQELGPDDLPEDVPRVLGVPPAYDAADREVERMRFAFARAFAHRIVEADGVVQDAEQHFMDQVFAPDLVERLGLSDGSFEEEYLRKALEELPTRLGHHDKLALIGLFFSACCSDGSLDAREMRVLKDAGDALGIERERVVNYLQRFW